MEQRGQRLADVQPRRQPRADRRAPRVIAGAGFCGSGLLTDDLRVIRDGIGFAALRDLMATDVLLPAMIKIGSENGPATSGPLALAAPLRELAEQAVAHGTRVAIETMPFSAIATVPMGAEIVTAASHPAAGLLVDAWHVFRAGTSLSELRAALTPEMIFGVEILSSSYRRAGC